MLQVDIRGLGGAVRTERVVDDSQLHAPRMGGEVPLQIFRIMQKRAVVTGSTLRPRDPDEKARLAAEVERVVWPWIEAGKLVPQVDATFPLEDAAKAHAHLEAGAHLGKIVLTVK